MKQVLSAASALVLAVISSAAQPARSVVGTVTSIASQTAQLTIKPDSGEPIIARISPDTVLQRIAPGERDLKKAEPILFANIAVGDRVLVSLEPSTPEARRIVVMSAADIDKRNQADRQSWIERGVSGIVAGRKGDEITLTVKASGAEKTVVVTLSARTTYRRYAPDSVRFADAKTSNREEIQIGDQLRARGEKSADRLRFTAEDVVFGTFLTRAGSVASVDAAAKEVRITELGSGKPLLVKLTADTLIKAMPDFGGGAPPMPAPQGGRGPTPSGATPFPPAGRGGAFARPDPSELIERMPRAEIDAIRPGQQILISSTKGAIADQLTAITIVANAQMLIQLASARSGAARSGAGRGGQDNAGAGLSPGVMSGMDLSGMVP